jgi:hypothetical protein
MTDAADAPLTSKRLVGNGDHISLIAEEFGFARFETILEAQENASLRSARTNPHQLVPDDLLFIPDRESHAADVPIDATSRVVIQRQRLFLRVKVVDLFGAPVASASGRLETETVTIRVATDSEGLLHVQIPRNTKQAELRINDLVFTILVGSLQPESFSEGIRARLINLGCWAGQPQVDDAGNEGEFKLGVELIQDELGLPVDGQLSPSLVEKLRTKHGQ